MKLVGSLLFILVILLVSVGTSQAAEPLTNDIIERWISSQKELSAWGDEHNEQLNFDDNEGFPSSAAEMLAPVKTAGLYSELKGIVSKYGFDNPDKWADASVRIIGAMGAIEIGDSMQGVDIQAQISEIQNAEGMSPAQKQQMIQMMQQSMGMMEQMASASDADIAAVKPYMNKISKALE